MVNYCKYSLDSVRLIRFVLVLLLSFCCILYCIRESVDSLCRDGAEIKKGEGFVLGGIGFT